MSDYLDKLETRDLAAMLAAQVSRAKISTLGMAIRDDNIEYHAVFRSDVMDALTAIADVVDQIAKRLDFLEAGES